MLLYVFPITVCVIYETKQKRKAEVSEFSQCWMN